MSHPVILITGALTGIGRATALAFAETGARLVVSGRREAEGKALEKELRELGADAHFILADVRRDEEVASLVDQTVARFGRIDAAVNNAGTEGQPGADHQPDRRELHRDVRHQRARHAAQHEARTARDVGAKERQRGERFVDLRS